MVVANFRAEGDFRIVLNENIIFERKEGKLSLVSPFTSIFSYVQSNSTQFSIEYDEVEKVLRIKSDANEGMNINVGDVQTFQVTEHQGITLI
ncbi:MAG: hypothetical protein ACO2PO_13860 [Candidatus Calescibacterium sp.]|jgi:hypothetical protein